MIAVYCHAEYGIQLVKAAVKNLGDSLIDRLIHLFLVYHMYILQVAFCFWYSGYYFLSPHHITTSSSALDTKPRRSAVECDVNTQHDDSVSMTTDNSFEDRSSSSPIAVTVINPLIQQQQSECPFQSQSSAESQTTHHNHNHSRSHSADSAGELSASGPRNINTTSHTFMSILCHPDPTSTHSADRHRR